MKISSQKYLNFEVSRLGLGCASAWGQRWFDERSAISIVDRAIDLGVTVFDTGASYSNGNAEPRLGKALKGKPIENFFLSTKTGTHISSSGRLYKDWSRSAIFQQIDQSRKNLGIDTIPLVYLHGPGAEDLKGELFETLREIQARNWVRRFGVNSFDDSVLKIVGAVDIIDVVMLDYSLLRVDRVHLIDELRAAEKIVVAGAALANQLYAPKFLLPKSKADIWYLLRALKGYKKEYLRARRLRFLRNVPGWTPAQIAIAFVLRNEMVATSMFSTTRLEHLEENVAAVFKPLPEEVVKALLHNSVC
jgi:aryl-alcohol dehydrogenase-like predicted oxidoreductase